MAVQIQWRRDTAANWTSADPTLAEGEAGYETDTGKLKVGDGATAWTSLGYFSAASVGGIPVETIDAKGDLIVGTADDTAARLAVGANETVLMADSGEAVGMKWSDSMKDSGPGAGAGIIQTPFHGDASTAQEVSPAPTAGQKWVITDIFLSAAADAEVHLEEETSGTTIFGPVFMAAKSSYQYSPRGKLKLATADRKVKVHSSTADHITAQISCVSEA